MVDQGQEVSLEGVHPSDYNPCQKKQNSAGVTFLDSRGLALPHFVFWVYFFAGKNPIDLRLMSRRISSETIA